MNFHLKVELIDRVAAIYRLAKTIGMKNQKVSVEILFRVLSVSMRSAKKYGE